MIDTPANVIRYLMILKGLGSHPENPNNLAWPIYVDRQPNVADQVTTANNPEEVLTLYNTQGTNHGRVHISGETIEHPGFQLLVRSPRSDRGYLKAESIRIALNEQVYRDEVWIHKIGEADRTYLVQSCQQKSQVLPLGKDRENDNCYLFTLNYTTVITPVLSGTGT